MKKRSKFKVLSGVGKRWKVKYFNDYDQAKQYWMAFMKLKKSGFAVIYDFEMDKFNRMTIKNGNPLTTGWKYFRNK